MKHKKNDPRIEALSKKILVDLENMESNVENEKPSVVSIQESKKNLPIPGSDLIVEKSQSEQLQELISKEDKNQGNVRKRGRPRKDPDTVGNNLSKGGRKVSIKMNISDLQDINDIACLFNIDPKNIYGELINSFLNVHAKNMHKVIQEKSDRLMHRKKTREENN